MAPNNAGLLVSKFLRSCLPALERSWDAAICLKAAQVVALNYRGASHRLIAGLRKINDISSLLGAYFINISPCSFLVLLFNMRYTNLLIVVSSLNALLHGQIKNCVTLLGVNAVALVNSTC